MIYTEYKTKHFELKRMLNENIIKKKKPFRAKRGLIKYNVNDSQLIKRTGKNEFAK